jgi:cystathionine gamma-synthase
MTKQTRPETVAAAHGIALDCDFHAVAPPIYLSSTFAFSGYQRGGPHEYTRTSNPTRGLLADTLARLEKGAGAVVTSSGMAAVDLVLSLLRPRDLVLASWALQN